MGGANIYRVVPGQAPQVWASGFTNVVDLAFAGNGDLLVVEIATNGILWGDFTGALKRVAAGGTVSTIMGAPLFAPYGIAVQGDERVRLELRRLRRRRRGPADRHRLSRHDPASRRAMASSMKAMVASWPAVTPSACSRASTWDRPVIEEQGDDRRHLVLGDAVRLRARR